ncbi:M12 family metallopeptidase [Lacibacter sp. H407]|uniref:M12 family metallopeptidase n=1 Tax=Lacibacter sp. H407 TaxID=3133423 RepID=UPI0030BABBA7
MTKLHCLLVPKKTSQKSYKYSNQSKQENLILLDQIVIKAMKNNLFTYIVVTTLISLILVCVFTFKINKLTNEVSGLVISKKWHENKENLKGFLVLNSTQTDTNKVLVNISYKEIDSFEVFQGDIILGKSGTMNMINNKFFGIDQIESLAILQPHLLWKSAEVYYAIDNSFDETDILNRLSQAFVQFEKTKVRFKIFSGSQDSYLVVTKSNGYASAVGRQKGAQQLFLPEEAEINKIVHELCHAIGLWHEHSRPDRDKYIKIRYENIPYEDTAQFSIVNNNASTYGTNYDCNSIMHYKATDFASRGKVSISKLQCKTVGMQNTLTETDIFGINQLYK